MIYAGFQMKSYWKSLAEVEFYEIFLELQKHLLFWVRFFVNQMCWGPLGRRLLHSAQQLLLASYAVPIYDTFYKQLHLSHNLAGVWSGEQPVPFVLD